MSADSITASREIPLGPAAAFSRFVDDFAVWWPREHCFCGEENLDRVHIDIVRGLWGETTKDGSEAVWGRVIDMDRPSRIVLGWQMDARPSPWIPEPDPQKASIVDVRFEPLGDATRVVVTHRDFGRHGDSAEPMRKVMIGLDRWREWLEDYARGL